MNCQKKLEAEGLSDSEEQTFCNQLEETLGKLDDVFAERIWIMKPDDCTQVFVNLSDSRSYHRDLKKQYEHIKFYGNRKIYPNRTIFDNAKVDQNQMEKMLMLFFRLLVPTGLEKDSMLPNHARRDDVKTSK